VAHLFVKQTHGAECPQCSSNPWTLRLPVDNTRLCKNVSHIAV